MHLRVRLFVRLLVGLLVCSGTAQAQQIKITNTIPNSVCAGSTIRVDYSYPSYIEFEKHRLYVYLNSVSGKSIVDSLSSVTHNASIDVPIPSNQPTGSYTLELLLTVKPVATDSYTTVSPPSNSFSINANPPPPTVTNLSVCQNKTPPLITTAVTASSGTLNWYTTPTTSTTVAPVLSTTNTTVASYSVSQSVNGCESPRNTITYTVNGLPNAPTLNPKELSYCQGIMAATLPTTLSGNALTWYTTETDNNPLTNLTPQTNVTGMTTYFASQTDATTGCESPRSSLVVRVNSRPARPQVTLNQPLVYCQATPAASLSATALPGNTLKWYVNETDNTPLTNLIPQTTEAKPTTYYVSQTDNYTCESDRASIMVTVNPKPVPPTVIPLNACLNTTPPSIISAVTNFEGSLKWGTSPSSITLTVPPSLSSSAPGPNTYYVTQTNQYGCTSDPASITYTVKSLPVAPSVAPNPLVLCQSSVAGPLSATGTGALTWYDPGNNVYASITPSTTTVGPTIYRVTQTVDGCESPPTSLTVVVIAKPTKPAVSTPVTYCQFSKAVSLSATGQNLKWYTMLTGRPASFSTDAPIPPTDKPGPFTYYVTQTDNNTCESDPASIDVQVKPKPQPPGTAPISFCANNVSSLTATPDPGGILNWYGTDPNSLTFTTTAPIPATTVTGAPVTYYVSQSVNGCESEKALLNVTINALPTAPTVSFTPINYCLGVTASPLSATADQGGSLRWYYAQTGGTPSSDPIQPQTTSSNPPTTYYYVSQVVNSCEGPRAKIAVTINPLPQAPTVAVSQLFCQGPSSVTLLATPTGTNALTWYDQNGAIISPIISTANPGTTPYFVSQTDATTKCISERATLTVTIIATPQPPASATVALCLNTTPTALTATAPDGGQLKWYAENGTALGAAPAPSTNTPGTTIYYVSQSIGSCEGPRATITVIVKPLPPKPTVVTPLSFCQNAPPASLSATGSGILYWYTDLNGTGSTQTPTISTLATGSNTYFVSQQVDGCEGLKEAIVVTIRALPQAPTVSATTIGRCQNTDPISLAASGASTGTLYWYLPNGTSTTATPVVSTSATGSFIYSVSQKVDGCESEKTSITVTITATPVPPGTAPASFCFGVPATPLSATATGSLNWYTANGTALGTTFSPPTTTIGPTTYYVSQSVNGCESTRAPLTVTVKPLPVAPTVSPVSLCQGAPSMALSATAPGTLKWYAPDGTPLSSAPSPPTSVVGTLAPYFVSQIVDGCEGPRAPITVTIKPQPAQPTVSSSPLIICQNTTTPVTLTATPSPGGSLNWYGTNPAGPASPALATPVVTTAGTFTYYVSQTVNGCESPQAPIIVFVQGTPGYPTIGAAPVYCQGGATTPLSASASPGGILNWYTGPMGGSASPTPPPLPTNAAGSFTVYVSQSINGCEGLRTSLTATIRAAPNPPNPVTFTFCQNTPATSLTAVANGGTLNWYDLPTGGNGSTLAPVPPTNATTTIYRYVSLTDLNGCESTRTTITVKINAQPNAPTTTALSVCQNTTPPLLTLSVGATGTLNWYTGQAGGTPSPATPVPPTTNAGTLTYFVSQTDAATGCESPRTLLLVNVTPTPSAPAILAIAPICQGPTPAVLTAGGQNLKWYADATSTTPISQGNSFIQSAAQPGPFAYYVSQTVSSCEGPRARVDVVVNAVPAPPAVTPVRSDCQDVQAQPLTAVGTALQWYNQNDELTGTPTPNTRVDATQTTTYKVTQTVNGCTSTKAIITYTITVTPPPSVAPSIDFCQTQPVKQLTAVGASLKWYDPSGNATTGLVTTAGSYSVTQTVQGCESRKKEIVVTISPQATATLTGSTSISQGSSVTLTLTGTGSYSYVLSNETSGAVISASPSGTTVQPIVVTPGATTTYSIRSIMNACGTGVGSGSAVVTVTPPTITTGNLSATSICSGTSLNVLFTSTGTFAPGNTFTAEITPATGTPTAPSYIPLPTALLPPTSGSQVQTLVVQLPTPITAGKYLLRVSASNASYPISSTLSSTTLTVRSLPTASLSASKPSVDRVGGKTQPVELLVNLSGEKPWSLTYTSTTSKSQSTSTATTEANPYRLTVIPDTVTTYRLLAVSSSNGCGLGKIEGVDSVRIIVNTVTGEADPFSNTVKVYPVPTNGAVTVDIDLPLPQPAQLRLTNLNGQTTQQLTTRQRQTTLYLNQEPGGTYLLYIKIGDKWTVRRILKQ